MMSGKKSGRLALGSWLILIVVTLIISYGFSYRYNVYFALGNILFDGNILNHNVYNIDAAQYFLKKASKEKPPRMWVYYQLSRIAFIRGELYQAVNYAEKELLLYPENCRTYYIRGLAYGYLDDLDFAIRDFKTFNNDCVKDSWAGHNDLAWFYFRKGEIKKMVDTVEEVLYKNNNSLNPWLQNTYGVGLMNTGLYKEARAALLTAQYQASHMSPDDWGRAYPGNNPVIYSDGVSAMLESIKENLKILDNLEHQGKSSTIHKKYQ